MEGCGKKEGLEAPQKMSRLYPASLSVALDFDLMVEVRRRSHPTKAAEWGHNIAQDVSPE